MVYAGSSSSRAIGEPAATCGSLTFLFADQALEFDLENQLAPVAAHEMGARRPRLASCRL